MGLVHFVETEEISNFDSLEPLNLVRENGWWPGVPIKKRAGSSLGGNVRSLLANHARKFKISTFEPIR
jgi:hypothetical protein